MSTQNTNYAKGIGAEDMAARYLEAQGYTIIARRYKTKWGEIDLIARDAEILCFIEVKIRQTEAQALEAITLRARRRIEQSALFFLTQHPEYEGFTLRFDVIAVTRPFKILHLDNAWQAQS